MISSKRKPYLIETDRGKEIYNYIHQDFQNKNTFKLYSRNSSFGSVFAERFTCTIRDLLKRPVFEKCDSTWIDVIPKKKTKQYNSRTHSSNNLTPIQANLKKKEGYVYNKLLDNRKRVSPKFKTNDLVRTADLKKSSQKEIQLIGLII